MAWAPAKRRPARRGAGSTALLLVGVAAVAIVVAAIGVLVTSGGSEGGSVPVGGGEQAVPAVASALAPTGEVTDMGLPVVEVPGYASGSVSAGGVAVQGADWSMGQVPLDVAVRPFWTLTNTGADPVEFGEPEAEVRAGCCPGPFAFGTTRLQPGESTMLTFELAMHEGMDGWHDMGVYVPVATASGQQVLELSVTGDFRN